MDQELEQATEQVNEILNTLERETKHAEHEAKRLLQHFGIKLEMLEVERIKQRISHLNDVV